MGADPIGQAVRDRPDIKFWLQDLEAPLDVSDATISAGLRSAVGELVAAATCYQTVLNQSLTKHTE